MKVVENGVVYRTNPKPQPANHAVEIETVTFATLAPNSTVQTNDQGILILSKPPRGGVGHYNTGDTLAYRASNNNNNATLSITENVGPCKYKVTVL